MAIGFPLLQTKLQRPRVLRNIRHADASETEKRIRRAHPEIAYVVVHTEP